MKDKNSRTYKKSTLLLLILTVVAIAVTITATTIGNRPATAVQGTPAKNSDNYYTPKISSSQENTTSASNSEESVDSYLITVCDGKIGVYKNGETKPFVTSDISVYLLPKTDVELLKKGIRAESFSEVKSILEDYR